MAATDEPAFDPAAAHPARPAPARGRLRLVEASDRQEGASFRARVVLEDPAGRRYEGRAELPVNEQNYLRVACRATLAALRQLLGEATDLDLIGVVRTPMQGGEVLVVQIASRRGGRAELLQGVAMASASPDLDAARAVLHATNRLVSHFLRS